MKTQIEMVKEICDTLEKIETICIKTMNTDGASHKQWALGEILRLINPEAYDTLGKAGYDMGQIP